MLEVRDVEGGDATKHCFNLDELVKDTSCKEVGIPRGENADVGSP